MANLCDLFLTNKHYKNLVVKMLEDEGDNVPSGLADLYLNTWVVPEREEEGTIEEGEKVELWEMELDQIDADGEGEEDTEPSEVEEEDEDEGDDVVVDPAENEGDTEEAVDEIESADDVEIEEDEEDELVAEIEI